MINQRIASSAEDGFLAMTIILVKRQFSELAEESSEARPVILNEMKNRITIVFTKRDKMLRYRSA